MNTLKLQYPTCRQLLADGRYCPCPALSDRSFCRHHTDERQRQRNLVKARQLKEYLEPKRAASDPGFRPEEELNAAIFDSLAFPTLDTSAAICVAVSNVARLLGGGYLTPKAAAVMAKLIRIAEINLRQNQAILRSGLPTPPVIADASSSSVSSVPSVVNGFLTNNEEQTTNNALLLHSDPVPPLADAASHDSEFSEGHDFSRAESRAAGAYRSPGSPAAPPLGWSAEGSGLSGNGKPETGNPLDSVPPLGDADGFVLPEEAHLKRHHDEAKSLYGADVANEDRAGFGNMPSIVDALDPKYAHLPHDQRGRAAYRDLKRLIDAAKPQKRSSSVPSMSSVVKKVSA